MLEHLLLQPRIFCRYQKTEEQVIGSENQCLKQKDMARVVCGWFWWGASYRRCFQCLWCLMWIRYFNYCHSNIDNSIERTMQTQNLVWADLLFPIKSIIVKSLVWVGSVQRLYFVEIYRTCVLDLTQFLTSSDDVDRSSDLSTQHCSVLGWFIWFIYVNILIALGVLPLLSETILSLFKFIVNIKWAAPMLW